MQMKYSFFMLVIVISAILISCGVNKKDKTSESNSNKNDSEFVLTRETPADFVHKDLSDYGFPLTVMVPPDADVYTSKLITDEGTSDQIVIQLNAASDVRMNIRNSKNTLAQYREDAENDIFKEFDRYVLENDSQVVYKATHDKNDSCFYLVCVVTGANSPFAIISDEFHEYGFNDIQKLYSIANSVKPIK